MTTEMNEREIKDRIEENIRRGREAEALLDNGTFKEAFSIVEGGLIKGWRESHGHDVKGREMLFVSLRMLDKVRETIKGAAESGVLAQKAVEDIKQMEAALQLNEPKFDYPEDALAAAAKLREALKTGASK